MQKRKTHFRGLLRGQLLHCLRCNNYVGPLSSSVYMCMRQGSTGSEKTCVEAVGRHGDKRAFQRGPMLSLKPRRGKRQTTQWKTFILIILSAKLFTPCTPAISQQHHTSLSCPLTIIKKLKTRLRSPQTSIFSSPFVFLTLSFTIEVYLFTFFKVPASLPISAGVRRENGFLGRCQSRTLMPGGPGGLMETNLQLTKCHYISIKRTTGTAQAACVTATLSLTGSDDCVWQSDFWLMFIFNTNKKIKNILSSLMNLIISLIV